METDLLELLCHCTTDATYSPAESVEIVPGPLAVNRQHSEAALQLVIVLIESKTHTAAV